MTLAKQLEATGILLSQKIGFIVSSSDATGELKERYARIGKVVVDIPDGAQNQEEVQDYDPKYDLLILWQVAMNTHLYMLRVTDGASVYALDQGGGIIIDKTDSRIYIGQSDIFMQAVCDTMCALAQ